MGIQNPSMTSKRQRPKEYKSRNFYQLLLNRKRTRRRLEGCKYLPQKNIFSIFLTLQLFVPKNKRLGGNTQWVQFLIKLHSPRSQKEPRGRQDKKTLWLFVPNSKRLRGYTHWVHFSWKSAHQPKRRNKEEHLKISHQEEPGSSLQQLGPWSSIMKCSGACRWGTLWAPPWTILQGGRPC